MGFRHLGLVLFALAAAPLVALGWVAVSFSTTAVKEEARRGAYDTAVLTSVFVDHHLQDRTEELDGYAQRRFTAALTARPDELEKAREAMVSLPLVIDGFGDAIFTDGNGLVLLDSSGANAPGRDLSYLEWFWPVVANGLPYMSVATKDDQARWVIWIAVPIIQEGRVNGILAGAYDVGHLRVDTVDYAQRLGLDLTITDKHGQAIIVTRGSSDLLWLDPRVQASVHGHTGVVDTVSGGRAVFSAYAPVHKAGWTVIADVPQAEALARIDGLMVGVGTMGGILLVILLGSVLIGMRMQRRSVIGERAAESLSGRVRSLQRIDAAARAVYTVHGSHAFNQIVDAARELAAGESAGLVVPGARSNQPAELALVSGEGALAAATTTLAGPVSEAIKSGALVVGDDLVAVPLVAGDKSLGALTVAGPGIGVRLDAEDIALLTQLAQHAVAAVQAERYDREREGLMSELRDQYEQLNDANRLKSEFLASMSHELRTPLSAVIGFADLLLDGIDGALNSEQHEDIAQIRSSGTSLLELINEILDLSKIEAGKMTLDLAEVDLGEVVNGVCDTIQPLAAAKKLRLHSEVPLGLSVTGDALRIRQVLTNLVANAVKFTSEGEVVVQCEAGAAEVRIAVSDTGIGISADAQQFVFEEFRQAEAGTTRKYGGTGLGLAIAKKLVELQRGRIGLDSEVGSGTTFWFTLPRSKPVAAPAAAPVRNRRLTLAPPTRDVVLVIDDEAATRRVIVRRLQESGFHTEEAATSEAALRLARELHPAAITLDVIMPGADGWRVLSELKSDPATADIPVVVVSILDGREVALEMGASAYLAKPFRKSELIGAVRGALGRLDGVDVLCVDDERSARDLVRRTLVSAGARVRAGASGARALSEVRDKVPDAVCVDLMMPDMSGFELVSRLRQIEAMRRVPIIVISAKDLEPDDVAALSGNVERFITKARLQPGDLCATVRQTINWSQGPIHAN